MTVEEWIADWKKTINDVFDEEIAKLKAIQKEIENSCLNEPEAEKPTDASLEKDESLKK